jgi:alpha-glucosidase
MNISRQKLIFVLTVFFIHLCAYSWSQDKAVTLSSPDGQLKIIFRTVEDNSDETVRRKPSDGSVAEKLVYELSYKGKSLLEPSALGLELEGSRVLGADVSITQSKLSSGEDHYTLITGRTSAVSENYNSAVLDITDKRGENRKMQIEARAYDDAVAFRYIVPKQSSLIEYQLKAEKTEYRFIKDAICYAQMLPNFRSGYESEYYKLPISGLSNQGGVASSFLVGMPLLLDVWGVGWVALTEADLEGNAAIYLRNVNGSWSNHEFETVVAPNLQNSEIAVSGALPHQTAWRVIMVASDPCRFVESNVMTNLNPECRITDTSWIKPGKSAWNWWNGSLNKEGKSEFTTQNMKYYVDFAAEAGLEYMTVDAGWRGDDITVCNNNVDVPEVVQYAQTKGVKIFIWVDGTHLWRQMDEAFPLYEKWGVAGVKIDFILRDDQPGIDFYYRAAEEAAKHHLLVDFHGCTKTWGLQRTYPNVLGFEGVLGMEHSLAGVRDNPENHLLIPFIRMIGGLVDYTPGGFENVTRDNFEPRSPKPMVMGTRAHHLAMYVVYESPFPMVADWPETYKSDPSFKWIKEVPTSWDRSIVVNGYPGEFITFVRKKGNDWYLGAMTNWTARSYEIPLNFLEAGNYLAETYADAPDSGQYPQKVTIQTIKVTPNSKFKINMASAGGMAVHFKKIK